MKKVLFNKNTKRFFLKEKKEGQWTKFIWVNKWRMVWPYAYIQILIWSGTCTHSVTLLFGVYSFCSVYSCFHIFFGWSSCWWVFSFFFCVLYTAVCLLVFSTLSWRYQLIFRLWISLCYFSTLFLLHKSVVFYWYSRYQIR